LPVWHEVSKTDVLNFSPPLADKLAADTSVDSAERIALKILSVIRPDIAGKTPYEELKSIASGDAIDELRSEINRIRGALQEFQCPHCKSSLVESQQIPLDPEEKHWDMIRSFECGYTDLAGETKWPCPSDPNFPTIEEYDLQCKFVPEQPNFFQWSCNAFPQTEMARLISLPTTYGKTEKEAQKKMLEAWEERAHPWMRPMGVIPSEQ